jgi:hypothetical protein
MERRQFPRHTVDRPARIMITGGDSIPVRIANESRGGAKLSVRWLAGFPKPSIFKTGFRGLSCCKDDLETRQLHGRSVRQHKIRRASWRIWPATSLVHSIRAEVSRRSSSAQRFEGAMGLKGNERRPLKVREQGQPSTRVSGAAAGNSIRDPGRSPNQKTLDHHQGV